jgi:hypothetical protein
MHGVTVDLLAGLFQSITPGASGLDPQLERLRTILNAPTLVDPVCLQNMALLIGRKVLVACLCFFSTSAFQGVTKPECMAECRKLGAVPGSACAVYRFARPMPASKSSNLTLYSMLGA